MKKLTRTAIAGLLAVATTSASAILPLITDDTGTQRPNKTTHQLEFSYDRLRDRDAGVTGKAGISGVTYTYGINDPLDVYIGASYARVTVEDSFVPSFTRVSGQGDTGVGLKWRFYDKDQLSFAFKPQITLATGDENKGLGTGRTSGAMTFIATYDAEPVTWMANVAYMRNNYKLAADRAANRSDLVRISAAALVKVGDKARVFADIGGATNSDRTSNTRPAYFLTGLIYSPNKDIDFDVGVKFGISNPEIDRAWSIGATFRF
jgi:predicted porin